MIAAATAVFIAPVERWCEHAKNLQNDIDKVAAIVCGQPIVILPKTMFINAICGGRGWSVEAESEKKLTELCGGVYTGNPNFYVCEHMLEMD